METRRLKITNFKLNYDGMYHIETQNKKQFTIYIFPADLMKLFQKEGFSMNDVISSWNEKWELHFVKTVIRANPFFLNDECYNCITSESVEELNSLEVQLIDVLIE
jgi:hypothetical protein